MVVEAKPTAMTRTLLVALAVTAACLADGVSASDILDPAARRAGGAATVDRAGAKAFSQPVPQLGFQDEASFKAGNMFFRSPHVGEGPLLNARTCQGCHRQDGRGNVPDSPDQPLASMLMRLSGRTEAGWQPDPRYGHQLQPLGHAPGREQPVVAGETPPTDGAPGEAYVWIEYEPVQGRYPDGTAYTLRRPVYHLRDPAVGAFMDGVRFSPRVAPPVFGAGLLEAIPRERLETLADPGDADGDGISGRLRVTRDVLSGADAVGRFGHKGGAPTVLQQSAAAYRDDMGLTNRLFPEESCTGAQPACLRAAKSEAVAADAPADVDVSDLRLARVEFYVRHLAVPAARGWDTATGDWRPRVADGRRLFAETGCAACHVPGHTTGEAPGSVLGEIALLGLEGEARPRVSLSDQRIWPYTDLLLHDMGGSCRVAVETPAGEACDPAASDRCVWVQRCDGLADGRPEGNATGREWRTPPLWGLGLTRTVNPRAGYLHDGRARTVEEAILWHGGEASAARVAFMHLSANERAALIAFLHSL